MNTLTLEPSIPYDLTIRHKPWRPDHLRWVIQDWAGMSRQPEQDHRTRLHATLEWVCRAQDAWRNSADNGYVAWRALAWTKRSQRTAGNALALRDALPNAVPIETGPAAFNLEILAAKYFADTVMMDMVGMAIPPEVPEKYA